MSRLRKMILPGASLSSSEAANASRGNAPEEQDLVEQLRIVDYSMNTAQEHDKEREQRSAS